MAKKVAKSSSKKEVLKLDGTDLSSDDLVVKIIKEYKNALQKSKASEVVLDLTKIDKISSNGIGALVGLGLECVRENKNLTVDILDENVFNLLKSFKLDNQLNIKKG